MVEKSLLIIQARVGSTRLPRKTVLPFFEGKSIFNIIIDNLIPIFPRSDIVLATTIDPSDNVLVEQAEQAELKVFRGSIDDVLSRFLGAAHEYASVPTIPFQCRS